MSYGTKGKEGMCAYGIIGFIHKNSNLSEYSYLYTKGGFIKLLGVVEVFFGIFDA